MHEIQEARGRRRSRGSPRAARRPARGRSGPARSAPPSRTRSQPLSSGRSGCWRCSSSERYVPTSRTPTPRSARTRKAITSSVARSAQCRSSSTSMQRPFRGQALHHAEHELDELRRRRRLAAPWDRLRVQLGQQAGEPAARRPEQRGQLLLGGRARQRAQRVGERRQREAVAAELHARAAEHARAARRRGGGQLADEPRLADPGLAADERHGGLAGAAPARARAISRASSCSRPTKTALMDPLATTGILYRGASPSTSRRAGQPRRGATRSRRP